MNYPRIYKSIAVAKKYRRKADWFARLESLVETPQPPPIGWRDDATHLYHRGYSVERACKELGRIYGIYS